jgi:hypothetical protein
VTHPLLRIRCPTLLYFELSRAAVDDFRKLVSDRISNQPFPRPNGWDIVILAADKARILRAYWTLVQW